MLPTTVSFVISALALGFGAEVIAQSSPFTVTSYSETVVSVFPTGGSSGTTRLESGFPLVCAIGCQAVTPVYYACFINTTQLDGTTIPDEFCNEFFCSQGNFTQLEDCLNCVIANGDERPPGYHTNSSITAAPTQRAGPAGVDLPYNPLGLVDLEQANGWLANITERCDSVDRPVTGASTVTATPTTTGPYFISFSSGETVSYPIWTGLTQYPPPLQTLRIPADEAAAPSSGGSASQGGSASENGNGSPTSSAAADASGSSPANGAMPGRQGSAGLGLMGMILAYAVM